MAHVIQLVSPAGTINLNDLTNYRLMDYTPVVGNGKTTVDTIGLQLIGTSAAEISNRLGSLNTALRQAREYAQNPTLDKCYLYYQPDGYTSAWRSELTPPENTFEIGYISLDQNAYAWGQWNQFRIRANLTLTRRDYWEGALATALITNSNGTSTATLPIFNFHDLLGTAPLIHDYSATIGTTITGDLPAPAILSMYVNNLGSNLTNANMSVFQHVHRGYGALTSYYDLGGTVAGVAYSQGTVNRFSWGGSGTTLAYGTIAIGTATIYDLRGQFVNCMLALGTPPPANTWMQFQLLNTDSDVLYTSPQIVLGTANYLQSLGVCKLPPIFFDTANQININLIVQRTGGGTLDLDYFNIMPLDSFRQFRNFSIQNGYGQINDDPFTGKTYATKTAYSNGIPAVVNTYGDFIQLYPGQTQSLYFIWENSIEPYHGYPFYVTVQYYPRKRNL